MKFITTIAAACLASGAAAQDLTVKAPPQDEAIAIVGATIHPVSSPTIENGYILFEDGRITAMGSGRPSRRGGPTIINARGKHVYPGLIGSVTRLGLDEISSVRAMRDFDETGSSTPEVYAAVSVNPDSTLIPVTRSNGILITGSFPSGGTIPGRASLIRMDGWTWQDMTIDPYAGLVINWPRSRPINAWWMNESESEQRAGIRSQLDAIDEIFDTAEAYFAARDADESQPVDIRWEAMRDVFPDADDQKPVLINANDVDQITSAVAWATRRGLRPIITGGRDADLVTDLLISNDVPVILSGVHNFPKRADQPFDHAFKLPLRLEEAGVQWALASGEETAHERSLPYNAAKAVAYGLSQDAAIRSITLSPAEILGIDDDYGHLAVGASATLIITDGTPLEIITHTERAFIDGREIDLSNKQEVLNEKYREKYRQLDMIDDND